MRYLVLIFLNTPVIFLAFLNIVTRYKMHRMPRNRFYGQLLLWIVILGVLISSFPVYNLIIGRPLLDSIDLSVFDIAEITTLIFLFYIVNDQRHKVDQAERRLRDLHQELSIQLSKNKK